MTNGRALDSFATARLIAERLREDHLADLIPLHLDPEVSRYLGGVRSAEATRDYLTVNLAHWEQYGFGLWVVKSPDGVFMGRAGIRHLWVDDVDEVEVAYTFAEPFWGHGFAGEVLVALVQIGFRQLSIPSLTGLVITGNGASRRVLERHGFKLKKESTFPGEPVMIYRLMNPAL